MKRINTGWLACWLILLAALPAKAVFQITRSVVGGGGGSGGSANFSANGNVGQAIVGIAQGPNYWLGSGFWAGPPVPTDAEETPDLPAVFELQQNHPNPFNPLTTIRYAVPQAARVLIKLHDIQGRELEILLDAEHAAGWYELDFNAGGLASGVYFYRMQAGRFSETRKLVLLK